MGKDDYPVLSAKRVSISMKNKSMTWWSWMAGLAPIVAYVIVSVRVANAIKSSPEFGGWSAILYYPVAQIAIVGVIFCCVHHHHIRHSEIKTKIPIIVLIILDAIIAIICGMLFCGYPQAALFWMGFN